MPQVASDPVVRRLPLARRGARARSPADGARSRPSNLLRGRAQPPISRAPHAGRQRPPAASPRPDRHSRPTNRKPPGKRKIKLQAEMTAPTRAAERRKAATQGRVHKRHRDSHKTQRLRPTRAAAKVVRDKPAQTNDGQTGAQIVQATPPSIPRRPRATTRPWQCRPRAKRRAPRCATAVPPRRRRNHGHTPKLASACRYARQRAGPRAAEARRKQSRRRQPPRPTPMPPQEPAGQRAGPRASRSRPDAANSRPSRRRLAHTGKARPARPPRCTAAEA